MLRDIAEKPVRRIVGLMSGTSVDGIDAALVELSGEQDAPSVRLLAFEDRPFPDAVRSGIFELFDPVKATVDKLGRMSYVLGELYAEAALSVIREAGLSPSEVDAVASHGQTIWHSPDEVQFCGQSARCTVQIGEGAVIAQRTGLVTVSDFRVADLAAGGQGAPLVPFTEYLLYRSTERTRLLQNIGGIGNMTVLPAGCAPEDVYAFDTGPGNMLIDAVVSAATEGRERYDRGGAMAARGHVDERLLAQLRAEPYYTLPLPKSTGRELFGTQYAERIFVWGREHGLSWEDLAATATELTAWSIADAYERYVLPKYKAAELLVGGGGSYNKTLLGRLAARFERFGVEVKTQEDLGFSSDAKEAVAFAILGDRCLAGLSNSLPGVTGATNASVMGKISLPPR